MPKKLTKEQFVERANKIHEDKYDYSAVEYVNNYTKVKIKCNKHGTIFWQTPGNHLSGITTCVACAVQKRKSTNISRYGFEHPLQVTEIQEKMRHTMLERYSVEHPLQSKIFISKSKQTCLANYGVEHPQQSEEIQEKTKQTSLERFGTEYASQSEEFQENVKQTNLKKFGVERPAQNQIAVDSLNKLKDMNWLKNEHHIEEKTLAQIGQELNVNESTVGRYLKKYNITNKYFRQSTGEKELGEFIRSLGYEILPNKKDILPDRLELDIFIPQLQIALEYNGIYWHKNKNINYHINKTILCKERNICLIHIWEDQWKNAQNKIKENITKFLNNQPQQPLTEEIEIDMATDNPQIYISLGYKIISQTEPQIYLEGIWDCGKMKLTKI